MDLRLAGTRGLLVLVALAAALTACTDEWHTTRIGDRDGFGWGTGQSLAAAGITSANLIPGTTDQYYPVNMTGQEVLGPGDFLPDMNALIGGNGKRNVWWTYQVNEPLPGDDWDNRTAAEIQGRVLIAQGYRNFDPTVSFLPTPDVIFGSQFTDLTLSRSYEASAALFPGDFGPFPKPPSDPCPGTTDCGPDVNNQPNRRDRVTGELSDECEDCFVFDFRVAKDALKSSASLYLNLVFADYDVGDAEVWLEFRNGNLLRVPLEKQQSEEDGLIQAAWVVLNNYVGFHDIFASDGDWWHCQLKVEFMDALCGTHGEPYTAFDFVEISTHQRSIGVVVVDPVTGQGDFTTIQEAIDASNVGRGTIIRVEPGIYNENIHMRGKDITLVSRDPRNPQNTVIYGDGTTSVVTFSGTESSFCTLRGFTIENGSAQDGGGINGNESRATIERCIVRNNHATRYGGGLAYCAGNVRLNKIHGNTSEFFGGGLAHCGSVQRNRIYENSAVVSAGGLYSAEWVVNNLFYGNAAPTGPLNHASAIVAGGGYEFYAHNTIAANEGGTASVIIVSTGTTFTNSIVWGNPADWEKIRTRTSYCVIQGGVDFAQRENHSFNFGNDPLFIDPGADDFRVADISLAVDNATDAGINRDFDGVVRPQGGGFDIGAYEKMVGDPDPLCLPDLPLRFSGMIAR